MYTATYLVLYTTEQCSCTFDSKSKN